MAAAHVLRQRQRPLTRFQEWNDLQWWIQGKTLPKDERKLLSGR